MTPPDATASGVTLRPATDADRSFLLALYASTREQELAVTRWPQATIDAFIAQQFAAQDIGWRQSYPDGTFDVVEVDGAPVGRLCVDRQPGEIHLIDIAIVLERRRTGIASQLVDALTAEADAAGLPLTLYVESSNPARGWYERLGFRWVEGANPYQRYQRDPGPDRPLS